MLLLVLGYFYIVLLWKGFSRALSIQQQINPEEDALKSLRQPDTCAYIDVLGQWWKWPDVRDIVLLYGCVMMVNGYVITVPPHNHRMAAAAQWQWPSHAYKKGRGNHLLGRGERQSHGKRGHTHTHTQWTPPFTPHHPQHQYTHANNDLVSI